VIEAAFGRLNNSSFFRMLFLFNTLPNFMTFIRAANGLNQLIHGALAEDSLLVEHEGSVIVEEELTTLNKLQEISEITRGWKETPVEDLALPQDLSLSSIREWALGPYSLRLATSYIHHKVCSEIFQAFRFLGNPSRQGIPSRFTSVHKQNIFLEFGQDMAEILSFCSCKSGARTVGGCAHAIAVLVYLDLCKRSDIKQEKQARSSSLRKGGGFFRLRQVLKCKGFRDSN
jgi:hypothetical protein